MYRFWDAFTYPLLQQLEPRIIIEIGSAQGKNTQLLLDYSRDHQATLHAIDPLPAFDVGAWEEKYGPHFVMHLAKSLDVLPAIEPADVALIDGDHNWYTVYNELKLLEQVAAEQNRPFPVALFHDIAWPYARRDLYYNPADVPPEFRHPYQVNGIVPGQSALRRHGFNYNLANAVIEGGPRNGVLTAVEDFIAESGEPLTLLLINGFSGLGILYPNSLPERSPALGDHLAFLAAMNRRIDGFLWQLEEDRINEILTSVRTMRRLNRLRSELQLTKPMDDASEELDDSRSVPSRSQLS